MEECSLDWVLLVTDRPFAFMVGDRGSFFQQLKLDFFRKSESIYFCNHKKAFLQ